MHTQVPTAALSDMANCLRASQNEDPAQKRQLLCREASAPPTSHQLLRQSQGQRVLRKGAGLLLVVAVHVARKLVQYQQLCQPPLWRGA